MPHSPLRSSVFAGAKTFSVSLSLLAIAVPAQATVIFSYADGNGSPIVSSVDLLQTSVLSADFGLETFDNESGAGKGGPGMIADGSGGGDVGSYVAATVAVVGTTINTKVGKTATYNFDLSSASAGYDIASLALFTGWDNSGRDEMNIEILYSVVAAPTTFVSLANPQYNTSSDADTWISALVAADTGALATGVAAIQFNFDLPVENGYVGIREIDVFGAATVVPEPSAFILLTGMMVLGLGIIRRRVH